jgi:hypothetical protein
LGESRLSDGLLVFFGLRPKKSQKGKRFGFDRANTKLALPGARVMRIFQGSRATVLTKPIWIWSRERQISPSNWLYPGQVL